MVKSETVKWMVRPQYDNITYYSTDIFKCLSNNHIVLIDWSGMPIMDRDLEVDSVTDFFGGYALALKSVRDGYKILGFFAEQEGHLFQRVSGDFYLTQYPFFSEGYLVVSNAKGKLGYIDANGQCVIDCKYDKARPFRKGVASVQIGSGQESRGYYINPWGQTKNPLGFHDGRIEKGSSFNDNGEAIVKYGWEYAIIDRNMSVLRERPYDRVFPIRTFDYAYSEDYVNPTPLTNNKPVSDDQYSVFENMSNYGYLRAGDHVVAPAQFDEAGPMCNGRAIVAKDGKYGVLALVEGEFLSVCSFDDGRLLVCPGMNCKNLRYEVLIPESFDRDRLRLLFDKGDGKMGEVDLALDFKPLFKEGDKTCTIRAQLRSDDELLLWEEERSMEIIYVQIDLSSPRTVSSFAKENGIQQIKACITNNTDFEVEVLPSFEVSFGRKSKNKVHSNTINDPIVLKPKEKKELFINVRVLENEDVNAKISVSVDGFECGSSSTQVSLKTI